MKLYKSDKYSVIEGSGKNIGFITCWNDPGIILKKFPDIKMYFSLMGTLYSREGVSIILRNLALNPNINKLVVYASNPLSNTEFGKAGRELLFEVWKNGVGEDGKVIGSNLTIHKEIDPKIISKIIQNVELIDISEIEFPKLQDKLIELEKSKQKKVYMQSTDFPETVRNTDVSFASEKVGFSFHGRKIYDTWLQVVESIVRYGDIKKTIGRSDVKELQVVNWTFDFEELENKFIPEIDKGVLQIIGLEKDSIESYEDIFINPENKKGSGYTYGERLRNYNQTIDQIDNIVKLIKEDKYSRRAVASTIIPETDAASTNPPCLIFVQAIVDIDSKLNLYATFRSHDIFKAAVPNAFGLLKLQDYICKETGILKGSICITSNSAHLYEEDFENAKKLLECQKWGELKTHFDELTDNDPRGIVRISIQNKQILASLMDKSGNELIEIIGNSSTEVGYKFSRLNLLSKNDHYIYLMKELIKAEFCIKLDLKYEQDKLFKISDKIFLN